MKQIWITKAGAPEVLKIREADDPVPGPDEVAIDVHAAGVNFADVLARMGMYPDAPPIPCVVGYEVAGTIAESGPETDDGSSSRDHPLPAGTRVLALTRFGGYASRVCVPVNQVFAIPDDMRFAEAASLPVNYFTAALAVERFGNLVPGERILIHNAGGGVGIAAIQLSRAIGAKIYGSASAWKHDQLKLLGVDRLVDYRTEDWVEAITASTGGEGVHVIIDPIGGRNLSLDLKVLAPLGRLVAFGLSEPVRNGRRSLLRTLRSVMAMPRPGFLTLLNRNWSIAGLNLGHLWSEIDRLRDVGDAIITGWTRGDLRPVIAAEIPFEEAGEAHRMLEERRNLGKVILTA